jgi:hypothetical protein
MAQTALTRTPGTSKYPIAGALVTMNAGDNINGNKTNLTGKEILIVRATAASLTLTISSTPDPQGRTKDITTEAFTNGDVKCYGPFELAGWQQADGQLYMTPSATTLLIGVLVLP